MKLTIEMDSNKVEIARDATTITEMLEAFEDSLLGLGFRFNGHFTIEDEHETK